MKRLVAEVSDDLMDLFKQAVSVQDITDEISKAYTAFKEAQTNEQQLDNEDYKDLDAWFDEYYSSIVPDCIEKAKDNYDFNQKYSMAEMSDIEDLKNKVAEYILNNKVGIFSQIQE